jgi:hypothetical protein
MIPSETRQAPLVSRPAAAAAPVLLLFVLVIWLPALSTPFWGDDYVFLQRAHAADAAGQPWWAAFWPDIPPKFWRPLSENTFWRAVDAVLSADVLSAHLLNLALLGLAACCVGLLGFVLARTCGWPTPSRVALLSGLVYGSLALHLLPVHWVSAANSSILATFTALSFLAWIAAPQAGPRTGPLLLAAMTVLMAAALLSKESAALIPLLMLMPSLFVTPQARAGSRELAVWVACLAIVGVWWLLHLRFTAETDAQYDLVFGGNLVRNALSLIAWLLNVPREALRMLQTGQVASGAAWAAAVAIPMLMAWVLAAGPLRRALNPRQTLAAVAFVAIAYAPYFPLAWNSYAYYAAVAAMLPAILLARGLIESRSAVVGVALIGLSSLIAVQGTCWLDHPGLIGRARWAEATLSGLEKEPIRTPLLVRAADPQRFYALGTAGLAWRLALDPRDVRLVGACPNGPSLCLLIDQDGGWSWAHALAPIPETLK